MKPQHSISFVLLVVVGALALFGCGGAPSPTPLPPTQVPTAIPTIPPPTATSTTAPTAVPATAAPTNTVAVPPTSAPGAGSASNTKTVTDAFQKFLSATTFRLSASATTSPVLFQPNYTPQAGDDPDRVAVVVMQGEQDNADFDYILKGFAASFIGIFAGFDPNSQELELKSVGDDHFVRGVKEGETSAKWYKLPADDTTTGGFSPAQLLAPVINAQYADTAFAAVGTEVVDSKNCGVFQGDRAAFELVLPKMSDSAILNTDAFDAGTVDSFNYKVWVCDDGNIHRVLYTFDAHTKADASKKGTFSFDTQVKDYDAAIVIQPPADAIVLASTETPTAEATTTIVATGNFTSLEGEWEGNIGEDSPLQFTVENNKITYVNINYAINTGGCSSSGSRGNSVDDGIAISNSVIDVTLTDSDNVKFTVTGKFESNNTASGSFSLKGKTFCGDTDITLPWTARHVSSPDQPEPTEEVTEEPTEEATNEPTEEATPAETTGSATDLVNGVFAALAKKDVTTALVAFDDDVIYNVGGTSGIGKTSLQSYMQLAVAAGATFKVSNIQDLGGIVTFTVTVSGVSAGTYTNSSAIVEDGKIAILTIQ